MSHNQRRALNLLATITAILVVAAVGVQFVPQHYLSCHLPSTASCSDVKAYEDGTIELRVQADLAGSEDPHAVLASDDCGTVKVGMASTSSEQDITFYCDRIPDEAELAILYTEDGQRRAIAGNLQ